MSNILKGLNESNYRSYDANRTGFRRGPRDDERHDLDVQQPSQQQWALKINGKVWSKDGKAVTFTSKEQALKVRQSLLAKRPELEVGLVTRGGVAEQQLDELSPQTLASYKKKAGADATASDKAGDTERANKRFSGIVKATKKEFDNDAKDIKEDEELDEDLHKWFKEKWVRFGPDGKIRGDCARGDDSEGKPKCLPQSKAHSLGKKGRASAASRKRREDPNPERSGKAINVNTKKKSNEGLNEFAAGGDFKPPMPPKNKGNDPFGNDDRSKIVQAVRQLLKAGNKVDWKVPGQMGHVVRADDDGVIMKRWGKPYSKIHYSLRMTDDLDDLYQILMVKPGYYKVVSSDPSWNLEEQELDEACWKGYHKEGNKKMFGKTYPNCVKNTNEEQELDEMDSQGYTGSRDKKSLSKYGSRDDYELGKGKEHTGKATTTDNMLKAAKKVWDYATEPVDAPNMDTYKKHRAKNIADIRKKKQQGVAEGSEFGWNETPELMHQISRHLNARDVSIAGQSGYDAGRDEYILNVETDDDRYFKVRVNGSGALMGVKRVNKQGVAEDDAGDVEKRMIAKIEKEKQRLEKLKQTDPAAYKREMEKHKQTNRIPPVSTFEGHSESCPHCGGEMVSEELMNEKKDACYYKVKSRYKVWPSAYASGALVKCRKKGASNWGNGGKSNESVEEGEVKQFPKKHRGDLEDTHSCVKCGGDLQGGTYMGHKVKVCMPCKQVYLPPNTGIDKRGNKVDEQDISEDQLDEKWSQKYKSSINCSNPKGFSQKAHCAGKNKNESAIMKGLK